jgi:hypothetical protein
MPPAAWQAKVTPRPFRPEATVQATIGLIAIALYFPGLRPEVFSAAADHLQLDPLWPLLQEICFSEEPPELLEATITPRFDESQRSFFCDFNLNYLPADEVRAASEAVDYVAAITRVRQREEAEHRRRAIASNQGDDAVAAQETINLLRQPRQEPH